MTDRPPPLLWIAWSLALLGGLALFAGLFLLLQDPCVDAATAQAVEGCDGVPTGPAALALGGTLVAVAGGGVATVTTLRRSSGR